jgi:hypothetical protein
MALILRYGTYRRFWEGFASQEILAETRLNLVALDYGYKYRLDIRPKSGPSRVEFVRTLREARFIGRPIRRAKGTVQFFRIRDNGTLETHQW